MKVYAPLVVKELTAFYGDLLTQVEKHSNLRSHLSALSERLFQGMQEGNNAVWSQVNNYHPSFLGKAQNELKVRSWSLEDARHTIANEYGFGHWEAVPNTPYNLLFEKTVNFLLDGDLPAVQRSIQQDISLLSATSQYGHKATLLHYCGSNGVEFWRQKVPANLPTIIEYLLSAGANKDAKMLVYGGKFTTLQLVLTSAHPKDAGLLNELVSVLR